MGRRLAFALALWVVPVLAGADADAISARKKVATIESDRLPQGSRVSFSPRELNAYVKGELLSDFPPGVREPLVEPGSGTATGSALVDFAKVRRAQGKEPGWLLSRLLEGERPVKVVTRIQSGGGRATVDVESVEVSGMTLDGPMLDFLIRNYLLPNYPEAKVGQPFELGHHIDRLEVGPAAVTVVIGR
jgi:hypothetical protein